MKTLRWAWQFLWSRPLAAGLNLLLLSLGLASITLVLLVNHQIQQAFARDLAGIDVVVGAKGSPLQLILSGVFQIDTPTGNVPLADMQALQANPQVAKLIPISMGDSFKGYRIIGTTPDYLSHYAGVMASGVMWQAPMLAA
jgi:putative ABC transport system permease protein